MNRLNKTALAIGFSLIGAVSSVSALAIAADNQQQFHEIKVKAGDATDVDVYVNADGDITNLSLPKLALRDKQELEKALETIPEDVREHLINALTDIHVDGKAVKIYAGNDIERHLAWEDDNFDSKGVKKVIKEFVIGDGEHKVVKVHHGEKAFSNSVIRLLEHGDFTQEELDKIQQALDAKR